VLAYALTALAVGVAMLAVALVIGAILLPSESGEDLAGGDYARLIAGGLITAGLITSLGVGVGLLVRNQVAGVVGALVWIFILEPLVGVVDEDLVGYTVLQAAGTVGGSDSDQSLSFGGSVIVLAAWALVFIAAGMLVDRRRDVD
jgi:ABC-2 type transport system permease protein